MTLPVKLIAGGSGIAIAGIGSWGGYELLRTKNVKDHLSKNGHIILDIKAKYKSIQEQNEDYNNWKEIISKYASSNADIKNFSNWGDSPQEYEKINKLKEACASVFNIPENSEDFNKKLQDAQKFCVKSK